MDFRNGSWIVIWPLMVALAVMAIASFALGAWMF